MVPGTVPSQILNGGGLHQSVLLVVLSILLIFVFFNSIKRNSQKTKNRNDSQRTIPKFRHQFSTGIPILDGMYTLYLIKKGMPIKLLYFKINFCNLFFFTLLHVYQLVYEFLKNGVQKLVLYFNFRLDQLTCILLEMHL